MGAAKHKGILPTDELIRAIHSASTKVDLSAAPWLHRQLGALEVLLEQVAKLDWNEYLGHRQAETAGGMGVYIQDPRELLQGVIQVLNEASEQKQVSTFNPTRQILEQIFKIRDGENRADFLVAFEDADGIHIVEGLAEYLLGQPNGKDLLRALLVNAGVERFLLSRQSAQGRRLRDVYRGIAHMIAEDMERIVLNISVNDPAFEAEYSPLDQAIMAFAREKLGAVPAVVAAPRPAAPVAPPSPIPPPAPAPAAPVITVPPAEDVTKLTSDINREINKGRKARRFQLTETQVRELLEVLPKANTGYGTHVQPVTVAKALSNHWEGFSKKTRIEDAANVCCLAAKYWPSSWEEKDFVGSLLGWREGLLKHVHGRKNATGMEILSQFLEFFQDESQRTGQNMALLVRAEKKLGHDQIDRLFKEGGIEKIQETISRSRPVVAPKPVVPAVPPTDFLDSLRKRVAAIRILVLVPSGPLTVGKWEEEFRPKMAEEIGRSTQGGEIRKEAEDLMEQAHQMIQIRELFDLMGPYGDEERALFRDSIVKLLGVHSQEVFPEWVGSFFGELYDMPPAAHPEGAPPEVDRLRSRQGRLQSRFDSRDPLPEKMGAAVLFLVDETQHRLTALEKGAPAAAAEGLLASVRKEFEGDPTIGLKDWEAFLELISELHEPASGWPEDVQQYLDGTKKELVDQFDGVLKGVVQELATRVGTWPEALQLIKKDSSANGITEDVLEGRINEKGLEDLFRKYAEQAAQAEEPAKRAATRVTEEVVGEPRLDRAEWLGRILDSLSENALRFLGGSENRDRQIETIGKILGNGKNGGDGRVLLAYLNVGLNSQDFVGAIQKGYDRIMAQTEGKSHEGSQNRAEGIQDSKLKAAIAFAILTDRVLMNHYFQEYLGRPEVTVLEGLYRAGRLDTLFIPSGQDSRTQISNRSRPLVSDYMELLHLESKIKPDKVYQADGSINLAALPSQEDFKDGIREYGAEKIPNTKIFLNPRATKAFERYLRFWVEDHGPRYGIPKKAGLEESSPARERIQVLRDRIAALEVFKEDPLFGEVVKEMIQHAEEELKAELRRLEVAEVSAQPEEPFAFPDETALVREPSKEDAGALVLEANRRLAELRGRSEGRDLPDINEEEASRVLARVHLWNTDPRYAGKDEYGKDRFVRIPHRVEGRLVQVDPVEVVIRSRKGVSLDVAIDIEYQSASSGIGPQELQETYEELGDREARDTLDRLVRLYEDGDGEVSLQDLKDALDKMGGIDLLEGVMEEVVFAQESRPYGDLLKEIVQGEVSTVDEARLLLDLDEVEGDGLSEPAGETSRGGHRPYRKRSSQTARRYFRELSSSERGALVKRLAVIRDETSGKVDRKLRIGVPLLLEALHEMGRQGEKKELGLLEASLRDILQEVIYKEELGPGEASMNRPYHWRLRKVMEQSSFSVEAARATLKQAGRKRHEEGDGTGLEESPESILGRALSEGPLRLPEGEITFWDGTRAVVLPPSVIPHISETAGYPTVLVDLEAARLPPALRIFDQAGLTSPPIGVSIIPVAKTKEGADEALTRMSPGDVLFVDADVVGLGEIPLVLRGTVIRISGRRAATLTAREVTAILQIAGLEKDHLFDVRSINSVNFSGTSYQVAVLSAA